MTGGDGGRTAAAAAARRSSTQAALARVRDVLARMRREKTPVTVAAVSRRAAVSRTFLYSNPEARALLAGAAADTRACTAQDLAGRDAGQEAAWRERIGELLGQVRDLEAEWTQDAIQRITTENTTLKQRVRQLTADNRALDERLKAARSNLRFQDRRVADLEARLLDPPQK